jgi:hypothetical protein
VTVTAGPDPVTAAGTSAPSRDGVQGTAPILTQVIDGALASDQRIARLAITCHK